MTKNQKIITGVVIGIIAFIAFVTIANIGKTQQMINNLTKRTIISSQNKSTNNSNSNMQPATEESPTFINTVWNANSIADSTPVSGTNVTVQFDAQGRVTGFDGCNNFNSTYIINGSELTINSPLASTLKACNEDIMNQADAFNKLLLASTSYKLGNGSLALNQGKNTGLTLTGQTNSLSKTSWNVTGYNNGNQAVVSPIIDTNLTMVFGDDGTISGNAGCNAYSGTYTLKGETISVTTLATTQRECIEPEGIMKQESSFLIYLEKSKTWQLQGDQLTLRTAEDQMSVTANRN